MLESKYAIRDGKLVNKASGEAIPDDEPVFIFRAKDVHAARAISAYGSLVEASGGDQAHVDAVFSDVVAFERFAAEHPERMREPDTARAGQHIKGI